MQLLARLSSILPVIRAGASGTQAILNDVSTYSPLDASADQYVEGLMKEWHTPGLAIAVIHENNTWAKVKI